MLSENQFQKVEKLLFRGKVELQIHILICGCYLRRSIVGEENCHCTRARQTCVLRQNDYTGGAFLYALP
jgi:hypothetical protein